MKYKAILNWKSHFNKHSSFLSRFNFFNEVSFILFSLADFCDVSCFSRGSCAFILAPSGSPATPMIAQCAFCLLPPTENEGTYSRLCRVRQWPSSAKGAILEVISSAIESSMVSSPEHMSEAPVIGQ